MTRPSERGGKLFFLQKCFLCNFSRFGIHFPQNINNGFSDILETELLLSDDLKNLKI